MAQDDQQSVNIADMFAEAFTADPHMILRAQDKKETGEISRTLLSILELFFSDADETIKLEEYADFCKAIRFVLFSL
jgi:hypothetical protein